MWQKPQSKTSEDLLRRIDGLVEEFEHNYKDLDETSKSLSVTSEYQKDNIINSPRIFCQNCRFLILLGGIRCWGLVQFWTITEVVGLISPPLL